HPAQVGDALHEGRHIGDACHRLGIVAADFLNLEDIDAVFLIGQREHQIFLAGCFRRFGLLDINLIGHGGAPVSVSVRFYTVARRWFWEVCMSAKTSTMRATLPSPRMVAAETPGIFL